MQAPFRLLAALRGSTEAGLMMAMAVATATFVATPLVLAGIADRFDVGTGTAGLFSAAQLGAFVVGSWVSGRFVDPSRRLFVQALVVLAIANAVSAVASVFILLVVMRAAAGLVLGVLAWLAYSQVFGDTDRTGDIAVIGPLTGVFMAPLFGVILANGDDRAVFWLLAVVALLPLVKVPQFVVGETVETDRTKPVPQALALVAALGVVTLGGSAVFVFAGAIAADQYGMAPFVISLVFSANAAASIPSARWRGARPLAGAWLLIPALCAGFIGFFDQAPIFWAILVAWGFCFWMAVPGIYTLLSQRSRHPAERAGDAQASMAAGRALGPLVGGLLVSSGSYELLGLAGGAVIAAAVIVIVGVELMGRGEAASGEATRS